MDDGTRAVLDLGDLLVDDDAVEDRWLGFQQASLPPRAQAKLRSWSGWRSPALQDALPADTGLFVAAKRGVSAAPRSAVDAQRPSTNATRYGLGAVKTW